VSEPLAARTGSAIGWQAAQLGGMKAIYLARILILAYLLSPDDFGLLAIAIVALDFVMQLTNIGLIPALVQRAEVEPRHYHAAWTLGVLRALLVGVAVFVAAPLIGSIFAEPRAVDVVRVLALRPLLEALASARLADLTRRLRFRSLAVVKLSQALTSTVVAIALARPYGVWALVVGALVGAAVGSAASYLVAPYLPRFALDRSAALGLFRFGRWIFATELIAVCGRSALHAVIARKLGVTELGLYFLAAKLAFLPAEVSGEVVGTVAFPLYARMQSNLRQAAKAFRTLLTGIAVLLLPVLGLIVVLAPSLVEHVLSERWAGTVPIIQVLAIACMLDLFRDAAVPIFNGLGQPYRVTILETVQSLVLIATVWALAERFGVVGAAAAWLPALAASQLIGFIFLRRMLDRPFQGLGRPMFTVICVSAVGALIAYAVDRSVPGLFGFVLAILLAIAIIGGALWIADRRFNLRLVETLARVFPRVAVLLGFSTG